MSKSFGLRWALAAAGTMILALAAACGGAEPEIVEVERIVEVEKEVVKEVPVEVVVEKEVVREVPVETVMIKEVPVEKIVKEIVEVEKEVVKEVPVEVVVEREVVKTVEVEKPVVIEVEKPVLVEREVVREVIVEKPVVTERIVEVVKEVEKIVEVRPTAVPVMPTGELRIAVAGVGPPAWHQYSSLFSRIAGFYGVGESLLGFDGRQITSLLADSWEVSADGVTYKLRSDVPFNHGWGTMTAHDVVATYQDTTREGAKGSASAKWNVDYSAVEAIDDQTVFMKFKGAPTIRWADIQMSGDLVGLDIWIQPKRVFDEKEDLWLVENPVGTGPFTVKEQVSGDFLELEAVAGHWRKTPGFANIMVLEVPEESTILALLKTGAVDGAEVSAGGYQQVRDVPGMKLYLGDSIPYTGSMVVIPTGQFYQTQNEDGTPLDFSGGKRERHTNLPWVGDPDAPDSMESARLVRWAMALAIDRQVIIDTILAGQGCQKHTLFFSDCHTQFRPKLYFDYDPDLARQYLADAGYPNGFEFKYNVLSDVGSEFEDIGEALIAMWEKVGLRPQVEKTAFLPIINDLSARVLNDKLWAGMYGGGGVGLEGAIADIENMTHLSVYSSFEYDTALQAFRDATSQVNRGDAWNSIRDLLGWAQHEMIGLPVVSWVKPIVAGSKVADWPMAVTKISRFEYIVPAR